MAKYLIGILGSQAAADALSGKPSEGFPAWSPNDLQVMYQFMESLNNDLAESGEFVDGQGLAEPRQAVLLSTDADGKPVVSEGPFGETHELLAGYWVVDCANIERAIEIAKRAQSCPIPAGMRPGDIIVHPILEAPSVG